MYPVCHLLTKLNSLTLRLKVFKLNVTKLFLFCFVFNVKFINSLNENHLIRLNQMCGSSLIHQC